MIIMIIGANGGLGKSLIKTLEKEEHQLILCSSKKIVKQHTIIHLDFLNDDYIKNINQIFNQMELPDIIIHCSGGSIEGDSHPLNMDILQKTFQLNLYASLEINKLLLNKAIKNHKPFKIIHVGSDSAVTGNAAPAYAMSKGALHTYIKNISKNYFQSNIQICAIMPSIFEHDKSIWGKRKLENISKYNLRKDKKPFKRFANVEDITEVILMIIFCKSNIFHGEIIPITGGEI
jgi:short-subunit dehydrogenase